jgi:hypothetical protein
MLGIEKDLLREAIALKKKRRKKILLFGNEFGALLSSMEY